MEESRLCSYKLPNSCFWDRATISGASDNPQLFSGSTAGGLRRQQTRFSSGFRPAPVPAPDTAMPMLCT